jgi:Phospholipase_D-nuclease N-terminal
MSLALSEDFPVLDMFWTLLLVFGWGLFLYVLFVVFRDLFDRDDVSTWGKVGWVVLVLVLPVIGSLVYLASQSREMGERELRRKGATVLRMNAYERSVTGDGHYRGLRDEATLHRDMTGPVRSA